MICFRVIQMLPDHALRRTRLSRRGREQDSLWDGSLSESL